MAKYLKPTFFLLGLSLFLWAITRVDLSEVASLLIDLGWGFVFIQVIYFFVTFVDTLAWRNNFKPDEVASISNFNLWRIRIIGEAFNVITPFGTMGGEPVKSQLLKDCHSLSFKQGMASQVIARTTLLIALILFLLIGTFLIFDASFVSDTFKQVSLVGLIVFSTLILLFFLFQVTGCLNQITSWISRFPVSEPIKPQLEQSQVLSDFMADYYKDHPMRFIRSALWGLSGWLIGIGELYATLYFLGYQPDFKDLWIIESLIQLVRVGSFFIPLSLGAQEGGLVLIFVSMGMTADLGLTVSFVRRLKELLWVGLGLQMSWSSAFKPGKIQWDASKSS